MTEIELVRFMQKVNINSVTGCWEWAGDIVGLGYGYAYINGKMQLAHRVSFEHFVGEILGRNQIDHKCSLKRCVNWEHLQQVSALTNVTLAVERKECYNSNKTHCPKGHPYDERNTYYVNAGVARHRKCRACSKERMRIVRAKERNA